MNDNLKKIGKNYNWLIKELDKFNIKPSEALIVTIDRRRKNFLSGKGKEKMREFIIITLILIIIIAGGIAVQCYLNKSSQNLINKLDEIKELAQNEDNMEKIKEKCDLLYNNDWKNTEKTWSIIVLHEELDLIEQALIEVKGHIEENDLRERKSRN